LCHGAKQDGAYKELLIFIHLPHERSTFQKFWCRG
jgi:hypothetical protein